MRIIDDIEFKAAEQATPVSTTAELLSARYKQAFQGSFSPARSDVLEYRDLEQSDDYNGPTKLSDVLFGPSLYERPPVERRANNTLTQAEAEAKAKSAGVKVVVPTTGMTEAGLDFLIKRRTEEMKREFVFSTAEKSFTNSALGFGADFAGMLSDPANVAFSFVPIVGPAKYTQLLAGAGGLAARTGIRAGIGAAEGLAGAAILEPFILSNRQELQDDYDIYDSMFNIASGAAFGSALHAGGGLFGDAASKALGYEPDWRKVQRANEIKAGTVKPVTLSDLDIKTAKQQLEIMDALSEVSLPRTGMEAANVIDARLAELRDSQIFKMPEASVATLKAELDEIETLLGGKDTVGQQLSVAQIDAATSRAAEIKDTIGQHNLAVRREGALAKLQDELDKIDLDSDLIALSEKISPTNKKYYELKESKELTPENRKALDTDIYAPIRPIMAQLAPETQARMFRAVIAQVAEGRPPDAMAAMLSDPKLIDMPGVREQVVKLAKENLAEPANITNRMAREADEAYARSLSTGDASKDAELLLYEQSTFADYIARSGLDKSEAEMKAITRAIEADELEFSKAKSQADAAKQAAACLMGAL